MPAVFLPAGQSECSFIGKFWCDRSAKCVSKRFRCDGKANCSHGEDEANCSDLSAGAEGGQGGEAQSTVLAISIPVAIGGVFVLIALPLICKLVCKRKRQDSSQNDPQEEGSRTSVDLTTDDSRGRTALRATTPTLSTLLQTYSENARSCHAAAGMQQQAEQQRAEQQQAEQQWTELPPGYNTLLFIVHPVGRQVEPVETAFMSDPPPYDHVVHGFGSARQENEVYAAYHIDSSDV